MTSQPSRSRRRRVRARHQALRRAEPTKGSSRPDAGRGQRPVADRPGRQDLRPRRAVRLRQDDLAQDGQPAHRADERADPHRRRRCRDARRDRAAPEHRLRHPAGRPVPAPDDRRERGHGAAPAGLDRRSASAARADELLALVGLDPAKYRDRFPSQLSGGERQRVGVARALAVDPPIMLMDEPFGAVDPIVRDRLQNEFLRLQEELAKTILFVTHDIDEAIKMGDLVAVFQDGGILAQFGTPAEILANPASEFVARFVGADRGLKRLALQPRRRPRARPAGRRPVGDDAADGAAPGARRDPFGYLLLVDDARPPDRLDPPRTTSRRAAPSTPRMANPVSPLGQPAHDAQGRALDDARRRRPGGASSSIGPAPCRAS